MRTIVKEDPAPETAEVKTAPENGSGETEEN